VKTYLHNLHCIIWSEQGHIFSILSLLCSDDAVIRFDIVWRRKKEKKKEALKYSSMSKSDVTFCYFVNIIHWYYLFLSFSHVTYRSVMWTKREKTEKNNLHLKTTELDKQSRFWCLSVERCWCCDLGCAQREDASSHHALRGGGGYFCYRMYVMLRGLKGMRHEGTASFHLECKQKEKKRKNKEKKYKIIFL